MSIATSPAPTPKRRKKYVPVVGPGLKKLLFVVFGLFALLGVNSVYLVSITILEYATSHVYQNYFYQLMFFMHLVLGLAIILPVVVFGLIHMKNARSRSNKRAARAGYGLFITSLLLLATGVVLMRLDAFGMRLEVRSPQFRQAAYWAHVITPLVAIWLFVLHRLAGKRIKWRIGLAWAVASGAFAVIMVAMHAQDPRAWNVVGPASGEKYFFPSLARTSTGNFIPADVLINDKYCKDCHADVHETWTHSVHRFASFNNPAYAFSVKNTRKAMFDRDGNVQGSRFCAGCHDPVPFFSGAFDDPKFDDPNYDLSSDAMAQAGITCTVCHTISHVNSPKGNGDYTIDEPAHYPFAFSKNPLLFWINKQLVKAKPEFHKKTFLKPLHKSAEFCGTCHKVHLPEELNAYKWLRGQNHYDSFLLSGVSGHGVQSFYYPPKSEPNCNNCHMKLSPSTDFGAQYFDDSGQLTVHDHMFPSANTAIPMLLDMPESVIEKHVAFNEGVMRVDIFGIREGGSIDQFLIAPLRPESPMLKPGGQYLIDTVIRTVKMGHHFTQGTVDSNEIWLELTVRCGDRVIAKIGGMNPDDGEVDPWSYFVNAYVIDRDGNRIDRRNPEDIFIALYNHQIPPGAADVVHGLFTVPEDVDGPITVDAKLHYRKFDTIYMRIFQGDDFVTNNLPIMLLAEDSVTLPVAGVAESIADLSPSPIDPWQRWNDYGIGLLRKGNAGANRGELRQADAAFGEVEKLGRPDGPLNRARTYIKEGRLDDAVTALRAAANFDPPAAPWSVAWFTGVVNKQNGYLDEAIENFHSIVKMDTEETRRRDFDFSKDYRLLAELGQTLFERAKQERGEARAAERLKLLKSAITWFDKALALDPENVPVHHNLGLIYSLLGDQEKATHHRELHEKYRPDDNARDHAIAAARRASAPANHSAEAVVIYDLQRPGAFGLPESVQKVAAK